jgi:hypothetical protein
MINDLAAAFYRRGDIDVPNSAAVHTDDTAIIIRPLLVRERARNGRGRDGTLNDIWAALVEGNVIAGVDIVASSHQSALGLAANGANSIMEEVVERRVIEDAGLLRDASNNAMRLPVDEDIWVRQVLQGVREPLDHVVFVAFFESGRGKSINGASADAGDHIVLKVFLVSILHKAVEDTRLISTVRSAAGESDCMTLGAKWPLITIIF